MSDQHITGTFEIHEVSDPELVSKVMDLLRGQSEPEVDYEPDLTRPMDDLWAVVAVNAKGEQRIITSPNDRSLPLIIPAADLLPSLRAVVDELDPRGDRIELRRYHLAETEDITPDVPTPKEDDRG